METWVENFKSIIISPVRHIVDITNDLKMFNENFQVDYGISRVQCVSIGDTIVAISKWPEILLVTVI